MSRSNNSGRGGYAPTAQPPQQQYHQPVQPQPGDGAWRHPLDGDPAYQPPAPPPPHWGQQPHAHAPHPHEADPYAGHPQHAHQPYAPHYSGQPQGYAPPNYPQPEAYAQPQDGYGRGGLASYSPQPNQDLSTFAPPPQWPQPPVHDPRGGYDLGEYAPGAAAPAQHGYSPTGHGEPGFTHDPFPPASARTQPAGGWHQQPSPAGYAHEPQFAPAPAYGDASLRTQTPAPAHGYPSPQVHAPDAFHQPHTGALNQAPHPQAGDLVDEDVEYDDLDDEQPRRGRTLLIVGALVGAIFVGGGLAYTYRALSGGSTAPALASAGKSKTSIAGPKVAEQVPKLPEVAPKALVASDTDTSGPRRVATIPVGPDGNAQPMPPPMAQPQTITMPGLAVTMPPAAPQREAQLPPVQPVPQGRPQPVAPPPVTQVPAPVQPKIITPPPQKQAALPEPRPPKEQRRVAKAKENDAFSPGGATASVATSPAAIPPAKTSAGGATNGYVAAILSTPKGKLEAMKAFADLQTKYPDVLSGKPAEVQEVNLGETKGVWYRAVVGPPGSRAGAAAVCEQLKAAGYTQCFATAY